MKNNFLDLKYFKIRLESMRGTFLVTSILLLMSSSLLAQYQMERLNRGLVAVRLGTSNFISWRWLGTEDEVSFNLYRGTTKINSLPLNVTNFTDAGAPATITYSVSAIVNGVEQLPSETATVWGQNYLQIPLQLPLGGSNASGAYTYTANDCSIGDVDGDGIYEVFLKWDPTNSKDNSIAGYTANTLIDAYRLDGTRLWRIDLGRNIRSGAHYTQFQVYDYDQDGKAEMMVKTADGTVDGTGKVIGNASADYRNSTGYILTGPEFLTVFNGQTGAAMATSNYIPARAGVTWGDNEGNRGDRFRAGTAYLDGKTPSAIFCRGYYARLAIAAWDWKDGRLTSRWTYDSGTTRGVTSLYGQGNHSLSIADVDDDGKQEIISGSGICDDDGRLYYSTNFGHGDAGHVGDLDPSLPGLEVYNIQEAFSNAACYMYSAKDKKVLWQKPAIAAGDDGEGPGRGVAADISAAFPGAESWVALSDITSVFDCKGRVTGLAYPSSCNFLSWWDGDLLRELLNGNTVTKYGGSTLLTATGCAANNGTKLTPNLSGDLFGDWREEVMLRTTDSRFLRIYTTTIPTSTKIRTLLHDPQYRVALAWQNSAYNQPPHPSFFIGPGMAVPPKPNIVTTAPIPTGLENSEEAMNSASCSPNPFQDELRLKAYGDFTYTIYDMLGNILDRGKGFNESLVVSNLSKGLYIVKIENMYVNRTFKVTKD